MSVSLIPEWLLNVSNATVTFGVGILVQSTVVIASGLLCAYALRNRGAAVQSTVLRTTLVAVFLLPLAAILMNIAGIQKLTVEIPQVLPERSIGITFREITERNDSAASNQLTQNILYNDNKNESSINPIFKNNSESKRSSDTAKNSLITPITIYPQKNTILYENGAVPLNKSRNIYNPVTRIPVTPPDTMNNNISALDIRSVVYLVFTVMWAAFSLFLFLRWVTANLQIQYLCYTAYSAKPSFRTSCSAIAHELEVKTPRVLQKLSVTSPVLAGFFRPFILLPLGEHEASLVPREVFLHELSHLKHHDFLWNQFRLIGTALLPFQPLIWALSHWIEETADYVSDDCVIRYAGNQRSYAASLLTFSQQFQVLKHELTVGVGFISFKSPLRRRIGRIFDSSHSRPLRTSARFFLCISLLGVIASFTAGFVGFEGKSPVQTEVSEDETPGKTTLVPQSETAAVFNKDSEFDTLTGSPHDNSIFSVSAIDTVEATESEKNIVSAELAVTSEEEITAPDNLGGEFAVKAVTGDDSMVSENVSAPETETAIMGKESEPVPESIHSVPAPVSSEPPQIAAKSEISAETLSGQNDVPASDTFEFAESNGSSSLLFITPELGMSMGASRDNNIKMPASKTLNVKVKFDYMNFDFDPQNEEDRRKYSLYHGLDKRKNEPAWSPDGNWIAFTDQNRIWIVSPYGGDPKLIYESFHEGFGVGNIESLCFTPDGSEVTFKKNVYDEERGSTIVINDFEDEGSYATFSDPIPNIESVNITTEEHRIIVEEGSQCCWSHNGRYLCYLNWNDFKNGTSDNEIPHGAPMLYDTETGSKTIVTYEIGKRYGRPAFSPDDSHVVLPVREGNDPIELFIITLSSGETEQLTTYDENNNYGKYLNYPEYSPNGNWILYTDFTLSEHNPDKRLFLYNTLSGKQFQIFNDVMLKNSLGKWSPDGENICFLVEEDGANYIYIYDFTPDNFQLEKPPADETPEPAVFSLHGNYPNPFNPATTIEFSIPDEEFTSLVIHNITGQKVRELVSGYLTPGVHAVAWDGCNDHGERVSSGVYLSRLQAGSHVETGRMTLVK